MLTPQEILRIKNKKRHIHRTIPKIYNKFIRKNIFVTPEQRKQRKWYALIKVITKFPPNFGRLQSPIEFLSEYHNTSSRVLKEELKNGQIILAVPFTQEIFD